MERDGGGRGHRGGEARLVRCCHGDGRHTRLLSGIADCRVEIAGPGSQPAISTRQSDSRLLTPDYEMSVTTSPLLRPYTLSFFGPVLLAKNQSSPAPPYKLSTALSSWTVVAF